MRILKGAVIFLVAGFLIAGLGASNAYAQRSTLVRDVDNGDRQTIIGPETLTIALVDGHAIDSACYPTNVPVGKRWVIDHLSAVATLPDSSQVPVAYFFTFDTHSRMHIPFTYQGGPVSLQYYWVGTLPIMLRLSAGDTLCAVFFRQGPGNAEGKIVFSGYQIDYP